MEAPETGLHSVVEVLLSTISIDEKENPCKFDRPSYTASMGEIRIAREQQLMYKPNAPVDRQCDDVPNKERPTTLK